MEGADEALHREARVSGAIAWTVFLLCLGVLFVLFRHLWDVVIEGGRGLYEGGILFILFGYFPALIFGSPVIGYMSLKGYVIARKGDLGLGLGFLCIAPVVLLLIIVPISHFLAFLLDDPLAYGLLVGGWVASALVSGLIGHSSGEVALKGEGGSRPHEEDSNEDPI